MRRELPATAHITAYNAHVQERAMAVEFGFAVRAPDFSHTRLVASGAVVAYRKDASSPSGVVRSASCLNVSEAESILALAGRRGIGCYA